MVFQIVLIIILEESELIHVVFIYIKIKIIKISTSYNVIMLIKSVVNKNKNDYY